MELIINKQYSNVREYLVEFLMLSKKNIHLLNMDKNSILVNGQISNLHSKLSKNDILKINYNFAKSNYRKNNSKNIKIEFEDEYILIASKPFGIKTHPNDEDEDNTLVNYLINKHEYLEPIHRLDIETCGLVIFAKTPLVKAKLDYMLEKKEIKRYYSAIVKKEIQPQKIIANIGRDRNIKNKMAVTKNGKTAITNILKCEKLENNFYKLLISLETGRTHQIRVHLAHLGANIVGDSLYSKDYNKFKNMYLGALKVKFIHPITEENITVHSSEYENTFKNKTARI